VGGSGSSIGSAVICSDNKIQQRCSDGSIKALAETCPSAVNSNTNPTVTCPSSVTAASYAACPAWCGNGKCDNDEGVDTCARDCASTPIQCPALDVSQENYNQLIAGYKEAQLKSRGVALSDAQAQGEYAKIYPTDADICQSSGYFEVKEVNGCGVCSPIVSKITAYAAGVGSGSSTGTTSTENQTNPDNVTNACGNSRCDDGEDLVSCPADCLLPEKQCVLNETIVKLGACDASKTYRCALNATDNSATVFSPDSTCTTNPDKVPENTGGASYDIKIVVAGVAVVALGGYYFLVMRKKKGTKR
jgi:hypothetical protein